MLEAEANRRVRMCNLQSAKDCASVKTSLATVHARAQEIGKFYLVPFSILKVIELAHGPHSDGSSQFRYYHDLEF